MGNNPFRYAAEPGSSPPPTQPSRTGQRRHPASPAAYGINVVLVVSGAQ
jgi:hypothetical protein